MKKVLSIVGPNLSFQPCTGIFGVSSVWSESAISLGGLALGSLGMMLCWSWVVLVVSKPKTVCFDIHYTEDFRTNGDRSPGYQI